ncbi:MAG: gamma carbonic anhydrase family protein [Ignavibacteriae bacterium]|nr:gamma carbonic anhydrase family protein [Ignavibacteriota bacterium]
MKTVPYNGVSPKIHATAFVAEGVHVIGDVELSAGVNVWFNSVLRGDINSIRIGERTNIQDCSVLHVTHECQVRIGSDVTIGHRAIIHGSTIGDCCLIGMGAVVLDDAHVESYSLVAAGAVVLEKFVVPEGSLVAGVPARVIRQLTETERNRILQSAHDYVNYARGYRT